MKIESKTYMAFSCLLGIIILIQLCMLSSNKKHIQKMVLDIDSLSKVNNEINGMLVDYRDRLNILLQDNGALAFSKNLETIIKDHSGLNMLRKENCVYIRISEDNCWDCIREISQYVNNNKIRNIVYLIRYQNDEAKKVLTEFADLKSPIVNYNDSIAAKIEEYNEPYMFTVNSENEIGNVLMPIRHDEKLLDIYFRHFAK